jgi:pilus assembly protein Flp/PilA
MVAQGDLVQQGLAGQPTGEKIAMQSAPNHVHSTLARGLGIVLSVVGSVQARFDDQKKDKGATAVEYGLLVGLIAIVIIVGVSALGGRLQAIFAQLAESLGG